VVQLDKHIYI